MKRYCCPFKIGISVSICVIFASSLFNSSIAQSLDNFKTYTNKEMNFSIQHPSNWKAEESSDGVYFTIREYDAEIGGFELTMHSYFQVQVEKVESYLNTNTMTLQNKSEEQYAQMTIDVMPSNSETLLRQNYVTVGGTLGVKLEYTSDENSIDQYGLKIFIVSDGKLYTLTYEDKPLKVPETLPLANKVVQSFRFLNDTPESDTPDALPNSSYQDKNCPPMSLVLCLGPED